MGMQAGKFASGFWWALARGMFLHQCLELGISRGCRLSAALCTILVFPGSKSALTQSSCLVHVPKTAPRLLNMSATSKQLSISNFTTLLELSFKSKIRTHFKVELALLYAMTQTNIFCWLVGGAVSPVISCGCKTTRCSLGQNIEWATSRVNQIDLAFS